MHRTIVEDEHTYAVRIDDGALLDAAEQIDHARGQLSDSGRRQIAGILGCEPERLDRELDTLAARATSRRSNCASPARWATAPATAAPPSSTIAVATFAAGIWVVDPAFMIDPRPGAAPGRRDRAAREQAYFAGARIDEDELRDAAAEDEQRRAQRRRGRPKPRAAMSGSGTTSAPD